MSDIDPSIVARLFEVKKNQLKMVERRGYNIPDFEKKIYTTTLPRFAQGYIEYADNNNKTFREVLRTIYENDSGDKLYVFYADSGPGTTQLGIEYVKPLVADMERYGIRNGIVIIPKKLSSDAAKAITGMISKNIQVFLEEEMAYDPTEHYLTPKHIPLTREQQDKFLHDNNIDIDQLPVILSSDIISRYYGLVSGQVVRIERENLFESMVMKSVCYKVIQD